MRGKRRYQDGYYVYRYIDETDGIVKYVGIAAKHVGEDGGDGLKKRVAAHKSTDEWRLDGAWTVEYFEVENKAIADAFETHLIALYGTDKYYNTMKVGWGTNKYLPCIEDRWVIYEKSKCKDADTVKVVAMFHQLMKGGHIKEAMMLFDCLDFGEDEGAA